MKRAKPSRAARLRSTGFTLIELLVVIAIIAILAAILFPVFARAKARALQTACLNNCRQIGLALQEYIDDWDGTMPPLQGHTVWGSQPPGWMERIYPYVRTKEVFRCPADGIHNYNYTMNGRSTNLSRDAVRAPAFFIHVFENHGSGANGRCKWCAQCAHEDAEDGDSDSTNEGQNTGHDDIVVPPATLHHLPHHLFFAGDEDGRRTLEAMHVLRHNGGQHLIFFDGHVRWFRYWDPTRMTLEPTGAP
jgi:prepilin-type N-terminal cleavage/methylation domain-containing protein